VSRRPATEPLRVRVPFRLTSWSVLLSALMNRVRRLVSVAS
jgi:hypothetical protein